MRKSAPREAWFPGAEFSEAFDMAKATLKVAGTDIVPAVTKELRRVTLAAVGAVAIAQEEFDKLLTKLVKRGEVAEAEAKKLFADMRKRSESAAKKAQETGKEAQGKIAERVKTYLAFRPERLLGRLGIPTKSDITGLSERVAKLTDRVEKLSASLDGRKRGR